MSRTRRIRTRRRIAVVCLIIGAAGILSVSPGSSLVTVMLTLPPPSATGSAPWPGRSATCAAREGGSDEDQDPQARAQGSAGRS